MFKFQCTCSQISLFYLTCCSELEQVHYKCDNAIFNLKRVIPYCRKFLFILGQHTSALQTDHQKNELWNVVREFSKPADTFIYAVWWLTGAWDMQQKRREDDNFSLVQLSSILHFSLIRSIWKTRLMKQKMPALVKAPTSQLQSRFNVWKEWKRIIFNWKVPSELEVFTFIAWYIDLKYVWLGVIFAANSHYKNLFT